MSSSVHLCRVRADGKNSLTMTLDKALRDELGLIARDVIGFRILRVQGRLLIVGEKIRFGDVARLAQLPADALPKKG